MDHRSREEAPVYRCAKWNRWLVTRLDEVPPIMRDPQSSSNAGLVCPRARTTSRLPARAKSCPLLLTQLAISTPAAANCDESSGPSALQQLRGDTHRDFRRVVSTNGQAQGANQALQNLFAHPVFPQLA